MKRIAAIVLSLLMLLSVTALAEQEKIDLFTTENGTKVTLTMSGAYSIEFAEEAPDNYAVATISRDELADVYVAITPNDSDVPYSYSDLSQEEKDAWLDYIREEYEGFAELTISEEVTKDGNAYLKIIAKDEGVEIHERFTVFEGYCFSRIQTSLTGLTDADEAFMEEVQSGMWVEPVAAE